MICKNCGNEMRPDARFCPHCGAVNGEIPGAAPYTGPEAPVGVGKKKTGLIVGAVAAAAAVIAVAAFVLLGGLFSNPKKHVEAAFVKSAAAYAQAEKALGLPDTVQWQSGRRLSQRLSLELNSFNSGLVDYDLSALEGLGLDLSLDYNGPDRQLAYGLRGYWGDEELLGLWLKARDAELYFSCPQLTGDVYYGVNTETLGDDLKAMDGDDAGELEGISFNLFELIDTMLEELDQEKLDQELAAANKALWDAAKVKKTGSKTLNLNGTETKATAYHVTIPQEALDRYVDDVTAFAPPLRILSLYREAFLAMGMPEDEVEEFLEYSEMLEDFKDVFHDALDSFGDLELDICLSGGYVSALLYEDKLRGEDISLALYLGGNGEYVDDLTAEFTVESIRITLSSSGDHGLKSGVYTDDTTIRLKQSGANVGRLTSDLSYDPRDSSFQWELGMDSSGLSLFKLAAAGSLTAEPDALSLDLEDISLRAVGMELCNLAFHYHLNCDPSPWQAEKVKLITQMDEDALMEMVLDTQQNVLDWSNEMERLFLSRLPAELLYDMMY